MYHLNHVYIYSSVALKTFTLLYNHHHIPSENHFPPSKLKLCLLNTKSPCLSPEPLEPTLLLSVDLTTMGTSYKWHHTLFALL